MNKPYSPVQPELPFEGGGGLWPKIQPLLMKFDDESYRHNRADPHHKPYAKYHVIQQLRSLMKAAPEGCGTAAETIEENLKRFETHNREVAGKTHWAGKVNADAENIARMRDIKNDVNRARLSAERLTQPKQLAQAWREDTQAGFTAPLTGICTLGERANLALACKQLGEALHDIEFKYPSLYQHYPPNPNYRAFIDDVYAAMETFRASCPQLPSGYKTLGPLLEAIEPSPTHKTHLPTRESVHAARDAAEQAYGRFIALWESRVDMMLKYDVADVNKRPDAQTLFALPSAVMDWAATRQWANLADTAVERIEQNFSTRTR